jgi:DNA-binding protein HU-beta
MARKSTPAKKSVAAKAARKAVASTPVRNTPIPKVAKPAPKAVASTPVRNTAIPKVAKSAPAAKAAPRAITHDMIAARAYEIACSGFGGSEFDNWLRAERELRGA